MTQTCEIPHLGKHWFNKEAITNIISLADLSDKHRITMDTEKEKSMIVHLGEKQVKFYQMPGGYMEEIQILKTKIKKIK